MAIRESNKYSSNMHQESQGKRYLISIVSNNNSLEINFNNDSSL